MSEHPKAAFGQLSTELLAQVCSQIPDRKDLYTLTLVCRSCNDVATEALYQSFEYVHSGCTPDKAFWPFIHTLQRKRHLAKLVKSIRLDERAYATWRLNAPDVWLDICSLEDESMRSLFGKIMNDVGDGDTWNLAHRFRLDDQLSPIPRLRLPSPTDAGSEDSLQCDATSSIISESQTPEGQDSYSYQVSEGSDEFYSSSAAQSSDADGSHDVADHNGQADLQSGAWDDGASAEDGQFEVLGINVQPDNKVVTSGRPRKFWDYLPREECNASNDAFSRSDNSTEEKTKLETSYQRKPVSEIVFWIQAHLEDLQLRAQSALLLVLCPNVTDLHLSVSHSTCRTNTAYVLQPLIAGGSGNFLGSFHGFPHLKTLTIDISAYTSTKTNDHTPLHDTELFSILCIPSLRWVTLVFMKIEDSDDPLWKRSSPSKRSLANLKSSITNLTLVRPHANIDRMADFFTWLAPSLLSLRIQDSAPNYMGDRGLQHKLFGSFFYEVLNYQNTYHISLDANSLYDRLEEVYLDLADGWLVDRWYLLMDEEYWPDVHTDFPDIGLWHAHCCLKKLTLMLVPLRRFLEPDWRDHAWDYKQVWTHTNIASAALRLTRIFPGSLEYLVLLVDPEWQYHNSHYYEGFSDPKADALFDETELRHACRGTGWCKATWAMIWDLAASYPHFSNLKRVTLEFHRVEACYIEQDITIPQFPRSGTQVVVWPPASDL